MKTKSFGLAATALAALLITAGTVAPAAARHGGGSGGHSMGSGGHSMGGHAAGARSMGGYSRGYARGYAGHSGHSGNSGTRVYGYAHRGGHGHARHFRGRGFGYAAPVYGYASSCDYEYRRAVATGNPYWWDRYYACTGDTDY